jgi:hypothetical protein
MPAAGAVVCVFFMNTAAMALSLSLILAPLESSVGIFRSLRAWAEISGMFTSMIADRSLPFQ